MSSNLIYSAFPLCPWRNIDTCGRLIYFETRQMHQPSPVALIKSLISKNSSYWYHMLCKHVFREMKNMFLDMQYA